MSVNLRYWARLQKKKDQTKIVEIYFWRTCNGEDQQCGVGDEILKSRPKWGNPQLILLVMRLDDAHQIYKKAPKGTKVDPNVKKSRWFHGSYFPD